jgi:NAD(P)-dependent dehydrogenase (short-subunit alcohol dehydrogenase family)
VIINIAALPGIEEGEAGFAAYRASMGGLIELTRAAARELEMHRVHVNAITSRFVEEEAVSNQEATEMPRRNSQGQPGLVQKIVEAVLYLCGPEGAEFSGKVIEMENGLNGRG